MKRCHVLLTGIMLLGLVIRCISLNSRGVWYDDAFSVFLAEKSLPAIISGTAADTMPPLYYFLLHYWMILWGQEVWVMRLLNVVFSMGIILLVYSCVARLLDETAGLWAALITALSPFQVYHAQELRMYVILCLSQLGYIWFFLRIWNKGKGQQSRRSWWNWLGLVLCGAVAMYSHNLGVFVLIVPVCFLLYRREWRLLGKLLISQVFTGLLFIPWLLMVPGQIDKIQRAFWTPRPGLVEIIQALIMFTATLPLPGGWQVIAILLSAEILAFIILITWKIREKGAEIILFLITALLPPIVMFAISYLMRPIFVPRGFIISSLAYYGLAGWVISKSKPGWLGKAVAGGFICASLISLPSQYTFNEFPRSPFLDAVKYLHSVYQPADVIVHDNKLSQFPCQFYARDLPQKFLADEPGSQNDTLAAASQQAMGLVPDVNIESAVGDHEKIYFVVFTRAIKEYQQLGKPDHPVLAWLKSHYKMADRRVFNDLEIYQFIQ